MIQLRPRLCIVKIGGSLLACPALPRLLEGWLNAQPPAIHVLICGGGPFTDAIRRADQQWMLGEEAAHWLCIDALSLTARLLATIIPIAPLLPTYAALQQHVASSRPGLIVFDAGEFLRVHESRLPGLPLPHTWQATTDSIAARLAEVIAADELILLKSAAPPSVGLAELALAGYVDPHFPIAARNVPRVECIHLRDA